MATPINQPAWPTDVRDREWVASIRSDGTVKVRHVAVLAPGEQLTEFPETWVLDSEEWEAAHATYGLERDGTPTTKLAERRGAWRKLRRMANGTTSYTETNVRDAFGALRRILQDLTDEVQDS
jgi:hypothetical protein